ncbi:MAG: DUF177 domain-containing protein [Acholeplasmatales bacterium]|nr:DUF177 domain-containing protein [Acholeplasmatales bacterium]
MKWTLGQLAKMSKPIMVDYELDLSNELDKMPDVKAITMVKISGSGYELGFDEYVFSLDIKCSLTMTCAISLEDVIYPLDFHTDEIFKTENNDGDDVNLVTNEINLDEIVLANIIMRIPMKVVKEGATYNNEEKEEEYINPAFADLKKYL